MGTGLLDRFRFSQCYFYVLLLFRLQSDAVRSSDLIYVFSGVTGTRAGQDTAWEFFKQHLDHLVDKYGGVNTNLFQMILQVFLESVHVQGGSKFPHNFKMLALGQY